MWLSKQWAGTPVVVPPKPAVDHKVDLQKLAALVQSGDPEAMEKIARSLQR